MDIYSYILDTCVLHMNSAADHMVILQFHTMRFLKYAIIVPQHGWIVGGLMEDRR